ncbi:MAG: ABC transporter permease [Curvibacter sp. RIFCSPHIGHO2_12_FULL_63_18]|uniref:FtsX-like permease family protein n=1 Tax=Rhodoferax sp. TaxID=50421 RepID=UPI0008B4CC83|nr:ABC transporter permease [Rhodoferax sp.]OGO94272.1 MAG: ABC transporter permease [Curvibacter sp. GWA2_63_95]OGP02814.1 MAG: ABC transporter permease [Curvibacter sp. RIFCSPHIGHO2_12_FULL_63_18]HCX83047.1 ABC transporter permease [Rhodoferax sp.]
MLLPLLTTFSWQELRQHPWRNAAAVVSVMLGVALAFAVHLINASALDEFSQAVRSVGGQPDLELRTAAGSASSVDLALWGQLLQHPDVAVAAPVLELSTYAIHAGQKTLLRVVGVDALQVAAVAPDLLPLPAANADRLAFFAPDTVFLNPLARQALPGATVQLQHGLGLHTLQVAGSVAAGGAPLAVMDIAAVQSLFGRSDLSRVDVRLRAGVDRAQFVRDVTEAADWPAGATLRAPGDAVERISNLSRAYRVNLTVLALVALFTGGFLVFSVLALSVARRAQQFALLGVLGLTGRQRLQLVLLEAAALGSVGSLLGLALGSALAALALRLLGGDLGGGFFAGSTPALQWSGAAALVFGLLGVAAALVGAWAPARLAQQLPPAQTLKGLGAPDASHHRAWLGAALLVAGGLLALLPPVWEIPLAAYLSVACLLLGGITALPAAVGWVLDGVAPFVARRALPLLAVERARRVRESAAVAVSGVVASLSLAVALTVMVASFRTSVTDWLDVVLPAALYVRTGTSGSTTEAAYFDPAFVQGAAQVPGVERLSTQRTLSLTLDPAQPAIALLVRPLRDAQTGALNLPSVGNPVPVPAGRVGVYVSEAMLDLYAARLGRDLPALSASFRPPAPVESAQTAIFFVAGVWRDYARQFGTVAMDPADFARYSRDTRVNDIAFWLHPEADVPQVQEQLRALANQLAHTPDGAAGNLLEFGSAREIRATSLKIFDRSFAVTYWLQAVAIGIGLFGVAASFSAQVLARRKEFGLLVHLGLTRRQILRVVALEGAAWTALGALAGVALGLAVAVVLVHVVNPQSFHWTMELALPWGRLAALAAAVVVAGTTTAWLSGQAAAGRDAVMAVKEDW